MKSVVSELFGKYISSDNPLTNETNFKDDEAFTDDTDTVVKATNSDHNVGSMSPVMEGLDNIVATIRTSVSDHGRLSNLFGGSFKKTTNTSETTGQCRRTISSIDDVSIRKLREGNDKENCNDTPGFDALRRTRAVSCGARHCQVQGCEIWKFGKGEKTLNLKRSTGSYTLNSLEENLSRKSSSSSSCDKSLHVRKRGNTCVIEETAPNEEDEHEISLPSRKNDELSFMDIIRKNLRSLEMNIVLRHRRYNKRAKRKHLADFYRAKYNTEASHSLKETQVKLGTATDGKSKGIQRLFDFVRTRFTAQRNNCTEADAVRKGVAIKVEKRKQLFKGKSRGEIRAHVRGKYGL